MKRHEPKTKRPFYPLDEVKQCLASRHYRINIDKYRCPNLHDGEDVYAHFYINDDTVTLVINSFKHL